MNPLNGSDTPAPVVTVNVRRPGEASAAIVIVADRVVSVTSVISAVTPVPINVIAVAPVRFVPLIVAETVEP